MKTIVSKELLSEVLEEDIFSIEEGISYIVGGYDTLLHYKTSSRFDICRTINIYELLHQCKMWALKNGYKLQDYANSIVIVNLNMNIEYAVIDDNFNNAYDTERFFKACQWILENK